jgi:hypothetical protein
VRSLFNIARIFEVEIRTEFAICFSRVLRRREMLFLAIGRNQEGQLYESTIFDATSPAIPVSGFAFRAKAAIRAAWRSHDFTPLAIPTSF